MPTRTSYWFSSRRSFRSCRVRLSLTRLHTARLVLLLIDSPLRVCAYLLRSFVYTTGVLAPDKPALCVCVALSRSRSRTRARARAHSRENASRGEGEEERRERKREKDDVCLRTPSASLLLSLSGDRAPPRSNRGRRFGTGQKHRSTGRVGPLGRVLREFVPEPNASPLSSIGTRRSRRRVLLAARSQISVGSDNDGVARQPWRNLREITLPSNCKLASRSLDLRQ